MAADAVANGAHANQIDESLRNKLGERLLALAKSERTLAVRTAAIFALGMLGFGAARPFLLEAIDDAAPEVRWNVAEALAHIGGSGARSALQARLKKETNKRVLDYIKHALAE